jgi:CDP-4-dehydro-6-deoxyglucose reductase
MTVEAGVVSNLLLNSYTHQLILHPLEPQKIDFKAGQFMLFQVRPGITRAYSLANPEQVQDRLEFIVDVRPGGPGSQFIQQVKEGDKITLHGPFGYFVLRSRKADKFFVATGCAIAPIKSMIETLLHRQDQDQISLYWGLRYLKDIYLADYFAKLSSEHSNFSAAICISRPEGSNPYFTGRVTEAIETAIVEPADYYLCGREAMRGEVKEILKRRGVTEEHIFFEGFKSQVC